MIKFVVASQPNISDEFADILDELINSSYSSIDSKIYDLSDIFDFFDNPENQETYKDLLTETVKKDLDLLRQLNEEIDYIEVF